MTAFLDSAADAVPAAALPATSISVVPEPGPAPVAGLGGGGANLPGIGETMLSMALVLGLIFLLAWGLRRLQGLRPGAAGSLRIHGGLQVGAKERVLLIEAGGRHLLIGVAPGQVSALHVYAEPPATGLAATVAEVCATAEPPPAAGAGTAAVPPTFAAALREVVGKSFGVRS